MNIRNDRVAIEASQEEIEALYKILKGTNSALTWTERGCTSEDIDIGCSIFECLRSYLGK